MRVSGDGELPVPRVLHVSPYDGITAESDHSLDETKSLLRFLRPINPDAIRNVTLRIQEQKKKPPLPKE